MTAKTQSDFIHRKRAALSIYLKLLFAVGAMLTTTFQVTKIILNNVMWLNPNP